MSASARRAPLRFSKMHGAGNDFVVIDCRDGATTISPALAAWLADRHRGIGCDQLLTIEPPRSPGAAFAYGIWNTDGSTARQCGNGARCVAAWAQRAGIVGPAAFVMDSPSGPVRVARVDASIEVELSTPEFTPAAIPFDGPAAGPEQIVVDGQPVPFTPVSLGNPHAVIEVGNSAAADVARIGRALQADARFPASCNVGFAQVLAVDRIRLRVFERGVGETLACGSGACAAVAVLARAGRVGAQVAVELPGGTLQIGWPGGSAPMRMRGPAEFVFEGVIDP